MNRRRTTYIPQIKLLLKAFDSKKISKDIWRQQDFPDEPKVFIYMNLFNFKNDFSQNKDFDELVSIGASSSSPESALIKCLSEGAERFCLIKFLENEFSYLKFSEIKDHTLDPVLLEADESSRKKKMAWLEGLNLTRNKKAMIPAQLVYISYKGPDEVILPYPKAGTGVAGGFDVTSTILNGIYEVVERDSFMTIYLNKIQPPMIDLRTINNGEVQRLSRDCKRYGLDLYVFDTTTDLEIPSFLTIIVDRGGVGPAVSCGLKAGFNTERAILSSIEEAFVTRRWIRSKLYKHKHRRKRFDVYKQISTPLKRAFFWSYPDRISLLNFLLDQKTKTYLVPPFRGTNKEELEKVKNGLGEKGHEIFYADITLPIFRTIGYHACRILIPDLQPFCVDEKDRIIRKKRMLEVNEYFGLKLNRLNLIPHPFW